MCACVFAYFAKKKLNKDKSETNGNDYLWAVGGNEAEE